MTVAFLPAASGNNLVLAAPVVIVGLFLAGLFALAWVRRLRSGLPRLEMSVDELTLARRAAEGETEAAEALQRLADAEVAELKRRAATDRDAALRYRDRIRQRLRTLEPLHGQLAGMELEDGRRGEIERRIAEQQTEALRELDWVEGRLERRGRR